jgi:hypothetical protein
MACWTPGRWRRYVPLKRREPLTLQHSVISQETRILEFRAVKNSKLDCRLKCVCPRMCTAMWLSGSNTAVTMNDFTIHKELGFSETCSFVIVAIGLWFTEGCVCSWILCWYSLNGNRSG